MLRDPRFYAWVVILCGFLFVLWSMGQIALALDEWEPF